MIKVLGVSKVYTRGDARTAALNGVSLDIKKGEFVSIMGPSGSGKSTLLHLLGALDTPTSGKVFLAEQDISALDDRALTLFRRKHLGFVFQFFNLLPTMSAVENAALPAMLCGVPPKLANQKAATLLGAVGIGHRLEHRPDQLSGGEMQRVAIARALVNDPVLILADEPTGNLDSAAGGEVLRILRQAARERQVTVVMVTHDPNAAAIGDRVVRLRDGLVVDDEATASTRAPVAVA